MKKKLLALTGGGLLISALASCSTSADTKATEQQANGADPYAGLGAYSDVYDEVSAQLAAVSLEEASAACAAVLDLTSGAKELFIDNAIAADETVEYGTTYYYVTQDVCMDREQFLNELSGGDASALTGSSGSNAANAICTPGYSPCLPPAPDYDCLGGSGDGPAYSGTVVVTGPDVYGLDRDGDGIGCQ